MTDPTTTTNIQHHRFNPIGPVAIAVSRNIEKPCKAHGCNESRSGLSLYCGSHTSVFKRYGHPNGRSIPPKDYRSYRAEVSDIFDANTAHPGYVSALDYLTKYMARAASASDDRDGPFKGSVEINRLASFGITPRDILLELCSFWTYLHDHPRALPDLRAEDWGLSRAVMSLAPRLRRYTSGRLALGGYSPKPKFSSLDSIGSHMRSVLSMFFVNVAMSVTTKEQRALVTLQALKAPLASPTAVYLAQAAAAATAPTAPAPSPEHSGR